MAAEKSRLKRIGSAINRSSRRTDSAQAQPGRRAHAWTTTPRARANTGWNSFTAGQGRKHGTAKRQFYRIATKLKATGAPIVSKCNLGKIYFTNAGNQKIELNSG